MAQSIDIFIVLRGRCIARKDDSINKASAPLTGFCQSGELLCCEWFDLQLEPGGDPCQPGSVFFHIVQHENVGGGLLADGFTVVRGANDAVLAQYNGHGKYFNDMNRNRKIPVAFFKKDCQILCNFSDTIELYPRGKSQK